MTSICRIIDALFRDPDDTVAAARLDIACTETGVSIEVGPRQCGSREPELQTNEVRRRP